MDKKPQLQGNHKEEIRPNRQGPYNVQATQNSENLFPWIAQGFPKACRDEAWDRYALDEDWDGE